MHSTFQQQQSEQKFRKMKPESAISVLRVSTKKQMSEGDGIENQRRNNNAYIQRKGYRLLKEFELAESADNKKRSEFDAVVDFVASHKAQIQVVVMYKVDRLSRGGLATYAVWKYKLEQLGIRLEFSTQEINGETPEGELMESMLACMARFENRLRTQRTIGTEKILTQQGYWCRPAPTGFVNARDKDGKPILKPTPDKAQWELLQYGLRKQASGVYKINEIVRELARNGLKSREGKPIRPQTWTKICRNPVYGGLLREQWTEGLEVRAKFDGAITPDEWHELQRALDGRKEVIVKMPRKRLNPEYPLRRFLRCPRCNAPTTGYPSRGKMGKIYHYYSCPHKECHFSISRDEGQRAFLKFMSEVTPTKDTLNLFREIVLEQWHERYRLLTRESTDWGKKVHGLREEKAKLVNLMKQNYDSPGLMKELKKDFERASGEYEHAMGSRNKKEVEHLDAEKVVTHCIYFMENVSKLWQKAPVEEKFRLQSLVLPEGVTYDALIGKQTPKLSSVYEAVRDVQCAQNPMAERRGQENNTSDPRGQQWHF